MCILGDWEQLCLSPKDLWNHCILGCLCLGSVTTGQLANSFLLFPELNSSAYMIFLCFSAGESQICVKTQPF